MVTHVEICADPVFVIGSPRSGTSVLAWGLSHHPDFWTSHETEFLIELFDEERAERAYETGVARSTTWLRHHGVERGEFLGYLGAGVNAMITSRAEGRRWVDQTPGYTLLADSLAELFPSAQFLHIVRDGRAVVHSMNSFHRTVGKELTDRDQLPSWARGFQVGATQWRTFVETATSFCERRPDRTLTISHEQLSSNPEEEFRRVFAFLRAEDNPDAATFVRTQRINSSFASSDWAANNGSNGAAAAWASWSKEERAMFVSEAGDLMVRLGFVAPGELQAAAAHAGGHSARLA